MVKVSMKNIKKIYDKSVVAVKDFNLDIEDKEFIVFVGPSGCGKSTLLRMIAGLEKISEGDLFIDGKCVNDVAPKDRDIAMVFQNYALYPHMTVYENMAFALKIRKVKKEIINQKVNEASEILGIKDLLERKPKALSGGQRQRVAIGRAIVRNPQVFLMDEPLSNLDAKLRNQMRAELIKLRKRINTTFIYVTHDQTEAMTLGDRIVIMKDGVMQQVGTPVEVYEKPNNIFVAGFIGTPQMNFFDSNLTIIKGDYYAVLDKDNKILLPKCMQDILKKNNNNNEEKVLGIRPEHIEIAEQGFENPLKATITLMEMMGNEVHIHVDILGESAIVRVLTSKLTSDEWARMTIDKRIYITIPKELIHVFDKETGLSIYYNEE